MALETGTYINDLVITNPTSTDPKSQGDDHLRLVKTILKNSFAGFPGMVIVTGTEAQGATVNDYTVTVSPAPSAYTASMLVVFKATHTNTSTCTLQVNGLGAKTMLDGMGNAIGAGFISTGEVEAAYYDGANFYCVSKQTAPTQASTDNSAKLATTAQVQSAILNAFANSPVFSGVPRAPTATTGTTGTQVATLDYVVGTAVAAASANTAPLWVSGTTYSYNDVRVSPITYIAYRRKSEGGGTTDPSLDAANWIVAANIQAVPIGGCILMLYSGNVVSVNGVDYLRCGTLALEASYPNYPTKWAWKEPAGFTPFYGIGAVEPQLSSTFINTGSLLLCINSSGQIVYSSDGITWTAATGPSSVNAITYQNNVFCATQSTASSRVTYTSSNGTVWTTNSTALPTAGLWEVKSANNQFLAVDKSNGSTAVAYSTNGSSWTAAATVAHTNSWRTPAYLNGYWVLFDSNSTTSCYSSTGASWTSMTGMPSSPSLPQFFAANSNAIIGTINQNTTTYAVSTNGTTWTTGTFPTSGTYYVRQTINDILFVNMNGGNFYFSTNGTSWTNTGISSSTYPYLAYFGGSYYAWGSAGTPKVSTDLITWSTFPYNVIATAANVGNSTVFNNYLICLPSSSIQARVIDIATVYVGQNTAPSVNPFTAYTRAQ
ncbi:MAG: hypothetical protein RL563_1100 [Pseudomonadota bacterium]|jgi:hypothetical protein